MKNLIFILLVIVILVAYCFGSAANFGYTAVPEYINKDIDILGGMSMTEWDKDTKARENRLKDLVRADYQPPRTGFHFGGERSYSKTHALTAEDYQAIVKGEPKLARELPVRDPENVLDLASMRYTVRDDMFNPNTGEMIAKSGTVLDKKTLDVLDGLGIQRIRIVGTGGVVSIESGTMLMVPLIFLALLAALKLIMFNPLTKIMDERSDEVTEGNEQAKLNRVEIAKLEVEGKERFDDLRREHIFALGKAKHRIMLESEKVVHEATEEAHDIRDAAHKELKEKLTEVEAELKSKVEELAQTIVEQVTKGGQA